MYVDVCFLHVSMSRCAHVCGDPRLTLTSGIIFHHWSSAMFVEAGSLNQTQSTQILLACLLWGFSSLLLPCLEFLESHCACLVVSGFPWDLNSSSHICVASTLTAELSLWPLIFFKYTSDMFWCTNVYWHLQDMQPHDRLLASFAPDTVLSKGV